MSVLIGNTSIVFPDGSSQSTATATLPDGDENNLGVWRLATAAETLGRGDNTALITAASVWHSGIMGAGGASNYWVNRAGSRSLGVTYTNTSQRAIAVSVTGASSSNQTWTVLTVDGVVVDNNGGDQDGGGANSQVFGIVPSGSTYRVDNNLGSFTHWAEMAA